MMDTLPRLDLPLPKSRVEPSHSVKLCYTLMYVAEAAGIRDLADGEYAPTDRTLEDGINRQIKFTGWTAAANLRAR